MGAYFNSFTPMYMGRGAALEIGRLISERGGHSVLLIHDVNLPAALVEPVVAAVRGAGLRCTVFCDLEAEVPDYCVQRALEALRATGDVDFLLALGGGSSMDCTKALNILVNNPGPLSRYYIRNGGKAEKPGLPIIAIPTTSGSGSEFMAAAVVCDSENEGQKCPLASPLCCATSLAVIDPCLMTTVPKDYTAITGVDVIGHCYEGYTGNTALWSPMLDQIALDGISLAVKYLPKAMKDLSNVDYREKLALASSFGGLSSEMGRGHMGHGFAHALGSTVHAPHGVCVAAAMPFVMEFITPARMEKNREVLRLFGGDCPEDASPAELGAALRDAVLAFFREVGVPTLDQYGATREKVMDAAKYAVKDVALRRIKGAEMDDEVVNQILTKICETYHLD